MKYFCLLLSLVAFASAQGQCTSYASCSQCTMDLDCMWCENSCVATSASCPPHKATYISSRCVCREQTTCSGCLSAECNWCEQDSFCGAARGCPSGLVQSCTASPPDDSSNEGGGISVVTWISISVGAVAFCATFGARMVQRMYGSKRALSNPLYSHPDPNRIQGFGSDDLELESAYSVSEKDQTQEMKDFLQSVGLEEYYDIFREHDFNMDSLKEFPNLPEERQTEIIPKIGHRVKLVKALRELSSEMFTGSSRSSSDSLDSPPIIQHGRRSSLRMEDQNFSPIPPPEVSPIPPAMSDQTPFSPIPPPMQESALPPAYEEEPSDIVLSGHPVGPSPPYESPRDQRSHSSGSEGSRSVGSGSD